MRSRVSVGWWKVSNPSCHRLETVGDLSATVRKFVSARGLYAVKVATDKVHGTDAMAEDYNVWSADKIGNDVARMVADLGRRRLAVRVADLGRALSEAMRVWYLMVPCT